LNQEINYVVTKKEMFINASLSNKFMGLFSEKQLTDLGAKVTKAS